MYNFSCAIITGSYAPTLNSFKEPFLEKKDSSMGAHEIRKKATEGKKPNFDMEVET